MAKSREKIQQLGFWDTEVAQPDHDTICLWAYQNAELISKQVFASEYNRPWNNSDITHDHRHTSQSAKDLAATFIKNNPRPDPRITKKTLEFVLKSYTGHEGNFERLVGYADLLIEISTPTIAPEYTLIDDSHSEYIFDGYKVAWRTGVESKRILVEVKAAIPTIGELMRQIQLYRTAFREKYVVVSPDARHAQILSEQGVTFIKYTGSDIDNSI